MKNKILIVTPYLIQGGVEHSLITALNGIDYQKNDVTLYLYKNELALLPYVPKEVHVIKDYNNTHYYRRPNIAISLAINTISKKLHFTRLQIKTQKYIKKYIHEKVIKYPNTKYFSKRKFDVVISYCLHIGTEMALEICSSKHYLFLHNSHIEYHQDIFERCVEKYDSIIAVCDGVKDVYSQAYPELTDRIKVIDNFVDDIEIKEKAKEYTINTEIDKDTLILCTCGRLAKEKGFDLAVEAAKILNDMGIDFIWYFVGDGPERTNIENMISANGLQDSFVITGMQENPYPYMRCCDIYVQPSYEEANPLSIIEAQILCKPIVSTETVGGRVRVSNNENGILTNISPNGLSRGIIQLINNLNLINFFQKNLSMISYVDKRKQYLNSWMELLEGKV